MNSKGTKTMSDHYEFKIGELQNRINELEDRIKRALDVLYSDKYEKTSKQFIDAIKILEGKINEK